MLQEWLKSSTPHTYGELIEALKAEVVEMDNLVQKSWCDTR